MTDAEFQAAFDQHKDAVYRFAWRMSGSTAAEDITQDVFVGLLRYPDRFALEGPMKGVQLKQVILVPQFWFAWSQFHQGTRVFPPR